MSDAWEVEDFLQDKGVWVNGMRKDNEPAHMDSYMSVTRYDVLVPAILEIKDRYTLDQWKQMADDWIWHKYHSPNCYLLGCEVYRTILRVERVAEGK